MEPGHALALLGAFQLPDPDPAVSADSRGCPPQLSAPLEAMFVAFEGTSSSGECTAQLLAMRPSYWQEALRRRLTRAVAELCPAGIVDYPPHAIVHGLMFEDQDWRTQERIDFIFQGLRRHLAGLQERALAHKMRSGAPGAEPRCDVMQMHRENVQQAATINFLQGQAAQHTGVLESLQWTAAHAQRQLAENSVAILNTLETLAAGLQARAAADPPAGAATHREAQLRAEIAALADSAARQEPLLEELAALRAEAGTLAATVATQNEIIAAQCGEAAALAAQREAEEGERTQQASASKSGAKTRASGSSPDLRRLRDEVAVLEAALAALRDSAIQQDKSMARLREDKTLLEQAAARSAEAAAADTSAAQLREALAAAESSANETASSSAQQRAETDRMLTTLRAELLAAETDGGKLRADAHGAEAAIAQLRSEAQGAEASIKKLRSEAQGSEAGIKKLRSEAQGAEASIKKLRSEAQGAEASIKKLRSEAQGAEATIKKLRSEAQGAEATIKQLTSEAQGAEATIKQLRNEARSAETTIKTLCLEARSAETTIKKLYEEAQGVAESLAGLREDSLGAHRAMAKMRAQGLGAARNAPSSRHEKPREVVSGTRAKGIAKLRAEGLALRKTVSIATADHPAPGGSSEDTIAALHRTIEGQEMFLNLATYLLAQCDAGEQGGLGNSATCRQEVAKWMASEKHWDRAICPLCAALSGPVSGTSESQPRVVCDACRAGAQPPARAPARAMPLACVLFAALLCVCASHASLLS